MTLVALTGGIGAGKSTVAKHLALLGADVFDADEFARAVVSKGSAGIEKVVQTFGNDVLTANGELNRTKLGEIVFSNKVAKQKLQGILHPLISKMADDSFNAILKSNPNAVIVYQIPLLVETGNIDKWDYIITAEAPVATRLERLIENRGMSRKDAESRINNQASGQERERIADFVLNTGVNIEHTKVAVEEIWRKIVNAK